MRKNVVKCQDAEQQAHVKSVNRNAGFFFFSEDKLLQLLQNYRKKNLIAK